MDVVRVNSNKKKPNNYYVATVVAVVVAVAAPATIVVIVRDQCRAYSTGRPLCEAKSDHSRP